MEERVENKDFIRFVNRIYYVNSHLAERLDELRSSPLFTHLQKEITATIILLDLQINQIDHLFNILGAVNSYGECVPVISFIESLFALIQTRENNTSYLSLLDYVSVSESLVEKSAKLAILSINQLPKLDLPHYNLYDPATLGLLKASLNDVCIAT